MLAFALLLAAGEMVHPSGVSASQMAKACQNLGDGTTINLCSAYALGVFDALSANHRICPSLGVDVAQAIAVGRKAYADHPENWDKYPEFVFERAYTSAFPCR